MTIALQKLDRPIRWRVIFIEFGRFGLFVSNGHPEVAGTPSQRQHPTDRTALNPHPRPQHLDLAELGPLPLLQLVDVVRCKLMRGCKAEMAKIWIGYIGVRYITFFRFIYRTKQRKNALSPGVESQTFI